MNKLVIFPERCTACRACELACSQSKEGAFVPALSRIKVVQFMEQGVHVPMVCTQCNRPVCLEACPTEALYLDRKIPAVKVRADLCVGCGKCVSACPFGAIDLHPETSAAYLCDLCGGKPVCVESCMTGALAYRSAESLASRKRRFAAGPVVRETLKEKGVSA